MGRLLLGKMEVIRLSFNHYKSTRFKMAIKSSLECHPESIRRILTLLRYNLPLKLNNSKSKKMSINSNKLVLLQWKWIGNKLKVKLGLKSIKGFM